MSQMAYTKIREDTFETMVINAGVLLTAFDVSTGSYSTTNIIGSTNGGLNFKATPSFKDMGDGIDNCPKNTKQLKRLEDWSVSISGTMITADTTAAKMLIGLADIDSTDTTKVTPRDTLSASDFNDLWLVVDYSDVNTGSTPGHCVIHIMDALSTGGFQIQTEDKDKAKFSFEFTAHYSIDAQDTVPFEVYIKKGVSSTAVPTIRLDKRVANVTVGGTVKLTPARVIPAGTTVTWTSGTTAKATVSNGTVTGVAAGSSIITASIAVNSVTYSDTCTVIVSASA